MWSIEQIIALAPDNRSAKSGRELATPRKWLAVGANERAVWGEFKGSAKEPYRTQIDLNRPAFKCSCPSRKFPCKHALGLFLLFANQPGTFSNSSAPLWVSEWLEKRSQRSDQDLKTKNNDEATDEGARKRQEARVRRSVKREERIREGLEEIELWLQDLVRQGLASVQTKPLSFWDAPAARLVDAQAPGLARRVREMASILASGDAWQEQLLEQIGQIYLAVNGYKNLESQSQKTQNDLKTLIGWKQDQGELLQHDGVTDSWLVMGKRLEDEPMGTLERSKTMKVQRTWLWGESSHQDALILHFSGPGQTPDTSLVPGTTFEADLVYFPGSFPLRALVKQRHSATKPCKRMPGFSSLLTAVNAYSTALAMNPWIDKFPMALERAIPHQVGETWGIRDADGRFIPIAPGFPSPWQLFALSGGKPIAVFGEWNGANFWPLSVFTDERWVNIS